MNYRAKPKSRNLPRDRNFAFSSFARMPTPPSPQEKKPAVKITGDPELWTLLQRAAASDGWTKTTRAMCTPAGLLINTCSRKSNPPLVAEALTLLPGCTLKAGKIVPL